MDTTHRVRRQTYEVTLKEEARAHALQERLGLIHRERVVPRLVGVLDAVADRTETIVLDRVELELGLIDEGELEEQLADRVVDALREALAEQLPRLSSTPARDQERRRIPPDRVDLEALSVFLTTGLMPWWASEAVRSSVDDLLARVLTEAPGPLRLFLRAGPRSLIAHRLAKQFSSLSVVSLRRVLAGPHAEAVEHIVAEWVSVLRGMPALHERGNVEQAIHARSIEHLIPGPDDAPGVSRMLLDWIGRELATEEKRLVTDLIQRTGAGGRRVPTLSAWLEDQSRTAVVSPVADPADGAIPAYGPPPVAPASGDAAVERREALEPSGPQKAPSHRQPSPAGARRTFADAGPLRTEPGGDRGGGDSRSDGAPDGEARPASSADDHTADVIDPPLEDRVPMDTLLDDDVGALISDAGLVLVWPFLTTFFKQLDLVRGNDFVTDAARERSVLLLRHFATGDLAMPEHALVLEKILCGWPLDEPVDGSLEPSDRELVETEELFDSILTTWKPLAGTSLDGFRSTFLLREGVLARQELGWHLTVSRTAFDVLLDQLPWGIGFVMLPWMQEPLAVQW